MKAKVKETGEIITVQCLYPVTYSRLDCNGKIIEEYDEDELEIIPTKPKKKMVSLDKVCEYWESRLTDLAGYNMAGKMLEDFRKDMEEDV